MQNHHNANSSTSSQRTAQNNGTCPSKGSKKIRKILLEDDLTPALASTSSYIKPNPEDLHPCDRLPCPLSYFLLTFALDSPQYKQMLPCVNFAINSFQRVLR
jgi:hypothetical protein